MLTAHSEAGVAIGNSSIAVERHRTAHEDAAAVLATPRDPDPWTQSLRPADLVRLAAESADEEQSARPAPKGLPWSASDAWELSEGQIQLLAFELLLLSRPIPDEPEPETDALPPPSPVRVLRGASAVRRARLAKVLSARIVRGLSDLEDEHEVASLPALLHPPPRAPDASAAAIPSEDATDAATDVADAAEAEDAPGAAPPALVPEEEPLEARLGRMAELLGPQAETAASAAAQWWEHAAGNASRSVHAWAHRAGVTPEPPPPEASPTRRYGRPRQRLHLDDALLEELRRQMGIRRDVAVRLSRLVLLPPPELIDGQVATALPTAAERQRYAKIQPYVPYRLMLLQRLLPVHFASLAEYAAFAERQLAAFTCGVLAALRRAPPGHSWEVHVVVAKGTEAQSLGAPAAEALLLRVARDEVLPTLRTALEGAHGAAFDERAAQEALRRLGSLAWSLLASMPASLGAGEGECGGADVDAGGLGAVGSWDGGAHVSELKLPFYRPTGLALYQSLVECAYGAADVASTALLSIPVMRPPPSHADCLPRRMPMVSLIAC